MADARDAFAAAVPKAELHLHIEGTLEPELMFALAARNGVKLRFRTVEEVRAAYRFTGPRSFLDIHYEGAGVLRTEEDFADLAWAYCSRVAPMGVSHAEVFFDPQAHTGRGIPDKVVLDGQTSALDRARRELGMTSKLIPCFLRHGRIDGVGLDSSEKGNPASKFVRVYGKARAAGLRATVNSDDPAYFGGYADANYRRTARALDLTKAELAALAKNSFLSSWLDDAAKARHLADIDRLAVL